MAKENKGQDFQDEVDRITSGEGTIPLRVFPSTEQPVGVSVVSSNGEIKIKRNTTLSAFVTKKNLVSGFLDVALLTANASQLKFVMHNEKLGYREILLASLCSSIGLQIIAGLCLMVQSFIDMDELLQGEDEKAMRKAAILNIAITTLIFFILILNIVISAFGLE